jgi:3-hydroxyisobutyrate dehydrogenase-like beta-hydroxyacid dehydrogenase
MTTTTNSDTSDISGSSALRTGAAKPPVTVIGLGPMGQAMVRALLRGGHPVTVWNRTASRADGVVAEGATRAATPPAALGAAELIVLSLTDYQAMDDIVGPVVDAGGSGSGPDAGSGSSGSPGGQGVLAGKVIVNLSSDTPERTRQAAAWADRHGARLVAGGVMVPAPMVGTDEAYVYYSGPREAFEAHEPALRLIGAPRYLGADPGLAQLFYQAQLDVFLTTLSGLLHATALVGSAGVTAAEFLPQALETVAGIPAMLGAGEDTAQHIDSGNHPGDLSTATMMGATADHILQASEAAGIDLALPRAIKAHYDRAIAAGHGQDNWTSLIETIKDPPPAS